MIDKLHDFIGSMCEGVAWLARNTRMIPWLVGSLCVYLSFLLLHLKTHGTLTGILGAFIGVSGIQILLSVFGIRTEILGSNSEPSTSKIAIRETASRYYDRFAERRDAEYLRLRQKLNELNSEIEIEELKQKVDELDKKLIGLRNP
jgi:hypothetical protein